MRLSILFCSFALMTAPVAATAGGGHAVVQHVFDMSDQDQDGVLSPEEYENAGLERYGVTFEQADADGDGKTSIDEYFELYEAHHPPADPADDDAA